jgi:hypothetical protein
MNGSSSENARAGRKTKEFSLHAKQKIKVVSRQRRARQRQIVRSCAIGHAIQTF